jgi:hypothetical protein
VKIRIDDLSIDFLQIFLILFNNQCVDPEKATITIPGRIWTPKTPR